MVESTQKKRGRPRDEQTDAEANQGFGSLADRFHGKLERPK